MKERGGAVPVPRFRPPVEEEVADTCLPHCISFVGVSTKCLVSSSRSVYVFFDNRQFFYGFVFGHSGILFLKKIVWAFGSGPQILDFVGFTSSDCQIGKTKVFLKVWGMAPLKMADDRVGVEIGGGGGWI